MVWEYHEKFNQKAAPVADREFLDSVEIMVCILDFMCVVKPTKVTQFAAERILIIAEGVPENNVRKFPLVLKTMMTLGYVTVSSRGKIQRTGKLMRITKPEHATLAADAFKKYFKIT